MSTSREAGSAHWTSSITNTVDRPAPIDMTSAFSTCISLDRVRARRTPQGRQQLCGPRDLTQDALTVRLAADASHRSTAITQGRKVD